MLNDEYKLIASVTVFRELYNADKDIYDVLEQFVNEIIVRKRIYTFGLSEITEILNSEYGFKLSESILRTCLRRMKIGRTNGVYKVVDYAKRRSKINTYIFESEEKQKKLFVKLFVFLENKTKKKLSEKDQNRIKEAFCDFLLQETMDDKDLYTRYFHEFILSIETNEEMRSVVNLVKEGTLIYEGIRYSSNINETGSWRTPLTIILDAENLFAVGGYNSDMYQSLYLELDQYIQEINRKHPSYSPKIKLVYFSETKREIEDYFSSAERIVAGLDIVDPTKEAMSQIVNGCETKADVRQKKAYFFQELKSRNITEYNKDFYDFSEQSNVDYNLESEQIVKKYSAKWNEKEENIHRSLCCLSHVNILRKGNSAEGFENCKYVFLTATGRTLKLARSEEIYTEGNVPLATTFDFLINRFWFKLNKGFGNNKTPRTIDMVVRARHVLSSIVNTIAAAKYDEFKKEYEQNKISKDQFCAANNELRSKLRTPEEIDSNTIGEEIIELEKWDMNCAVEEQKAKELRLKKAEGEIAALKAKLAQKDSKNNNLQNELTTFKNQFEETQSELFAEKQKNVKNISDIEALQKELDRNKRNEEVQRHKKLQRRYRRILAIGILLLVAAAGVYIYGSIYLKPWTNAVTALLGVIGVVPLAAGLLKKFKPNN